MVFDEKAVFVAALALPDAKAREAYLQEACCGQPELLGRLRELLSAHDGTQGPLDRPPAAPGVTVDAAHLQGPGTMIGPYKLLQQIGEGGMGTVWMAEQTQPVHRKVALKVIKPGMDSRQVIARFEAERQALAVMDHVNIARVFDGGTTEAGRPYFVMELVHGVPITKYCDDNHLTPRERLELFVPVCQAIQHAHQKGVIHRDVKPSNVMITLYDGKPVPKVIDFGVAKATEQKLTERTLFTQYGAMVGTLEYMSPEQAEMSALGVDTRTDIYSLGVLLYELLTGSTPLTHKRMKEAAHAEILRMIMEEEPPKPSTRLSDSGEALASISANRHTEPAKLTKLVKGELDWIVMKTLEKDRSRRYETANNFAADVQRYLNDEPVQACPPSAWYLFRKFARRNKPVLATAALFGVMLLAAVGAVTATVGWAVRDREAREQELARKVERDLALTEHGVRQAVEQAVKIRGELHAVLTKSGGVQELLNQPGRWNFLIQSAQSELAQARRSTARAEGSLNAELTQALHKLEEQLAGDEADRLLALRLEKIRLDRATWVEGSFDSRLAADEYPKAFAGFAVLKEDAATVAARLRSSPINEQLVAALDDWAFVAFALGNEPLAEQLLAVVRQAAPDPAWADRLRQVKGWRDQEALAKLVEEATATRLSPQMQALVGTLLPHQSSLQESWLRRAQMQYPADFWLNFSLANALGKTQPLEAAGFYRAALAVRPTSWAAYLNLGNALREAKKLPEAVAAHHKAIELDPKESLAYLNLGIALFDQQKLPEAVAAHHKAIELDPKHAAAHYNLGFVLQAQAKLDEAVNAYRTAIKLKPDFVVAYLNLGIVLQAQGKLDEAVNAYRTAIKLKPDDARGHYNLGIALRAQGKLTEAEAAYRAAIKLTPDDADSYINLGNALHAQGKLAEAEAACRRALELAPQHLSAKTGLAFVYRDLGWAKRGSHDWLAAQDHYAKYLKLAAEVAEANPLGKGNLAWAYRDLGDLYVEWEKPAAAREHYLKMLEVAKALAEANPKNAQAVTLGQMFVGRANGYLGHVSLELGDPAAQEYFRKTGDNGNLAWSLATCPDLKARDAGRAVELAKQVAELTPKDGNAWKILGAAQYRAGDWKAAIEALEKANQLKAGGDGYEWFYLAMTHWQRGDKEQARKWYERAVQWIEKENPRPGFVFGNKGGAQLRRLHAEATDLLGVKNPPPPRNADLPKK